MDTFSAYHADVPGPGWQPRVTALLREHERGAAALTGSARRRRCRSGAKDADPSGPSVTLTTVGTAHSHHCR